MNDVVRPNELTDPNNLAMTAQVRQATALAKSTLVPEIYRDNPANCMIAMEMANRIGASVMSVMQSLNVIHGKPSFSSSFLIATVNACGRFSPMRFTFDGEGEEYGCTARATDIKTGEECVGIKVTRKMAKDEGWSTKSGSKWKTLEPLMMTYRCATFWVRIYAPELSLGIRTTDEIEDIQAVVTTLADRTESVRPTRPLRLAALAPAATEGATALDTAIAEDAQPAAPGEPTEGGTI